MVPLLLHDLFVWSIRQPCSLCRNWGAGYADKILSPKKFFVWPLREVKGDVESVLSSVVCPHVSSSKLLKALRWILVILGGRHWNLYHLNLNLFNVGPIYLYLTWSLNKRLLIFAKRIKCIKTLACDRKCRPPHCDVRFYLKRSSMCWIFNETQRKLISGSVLYHIWRDHELRKVRLVSEIN